MHNEREFILYRAQRTNVNISQLIDGSGIAATRIRRIRLCITHYTGVIVAVLVLNEREGR